MYLSFKIKKILYADTFLVSIAVIAFEAFFEKIFKGKFFILFIKSNFNSFIFALSAFIPSSNISFNLSCNCNKIKTAGVNGVCPFWLSFKAIFKSKYKLLTLLFFILVIAFSDNINIANPGGRAKAF